MSIVNNYTSTNSTTNTSSTTSDPYDSLKTEDFINLLVTELQNQDPTAPVDNSTILNEISQIKAIQASQSLSDTLTSVLSGTNLSTASSLIGRSITGTDNATKSSITGTVDSITVNSDSSVTLNVGSYQVPLSSITQITTDPSAQSTDMNSLLNSLFGSGS